MRKRTGSPLPRQHKVAPIQNGGPSTAEDDGGDPEASRGWAKTWAWTLAGFFIYLAARWIMDVYIPADPLASAELFKQVPLMVYQMSSTAFFTALVLNLTSLLFEENSPKRQLALLSCAIKSAACHTDMLLVTGRPHVVFDAFGAILIPQRYAQWLVTTPTMVYILSKISDFTPQQTATAICLDVLMILSGLMASFAPGPYLNWLMFSVSMLSFMGVLYMMRRMVYSAVKEHTSHTSRRSLLFIYMCTLLIWSLFPVAWVLHVRNPTSPCGEYLNVFANFMGKVLFSSSIMYGNYMTISQRRLLAQKMAENVHRVQMIQELRDAVTRKDQFMSLMSHELRTPLNGIIQLSDALVRGAGGEMNPKGQHFVKTIRNSSNHLLNIINDILDVAALKEGKLTIKHELCSLAKAVDHVVDIVAPLARKDVVIERHVDPRTPLVIADFSRVVQILYNLAGNALKFTHRGRVCVRVAPTADGSAVMLLVEDTGIGIPAERINGIWGAFEQVDMSVTRKYGGTGLGLSIVKQLVEAHEGSIEVQSSEGQGTTFIVTLPVLQPNTRQSLEVQVTDSLMKCGHHRGAKSRSPVCRKGSQLLANTSSRRPSLEEAVSRLAREVGGVGRRKSGMISPPAHDAADGGGNVSGNSQESEDVLLRRRTQELERENLIGELQRRAEHRRSLEEARLVSEQLGLSGPERKAERDSRSLECVDLRIAAGAAALAAATGAAGGCASGGGSGRTIASGGGQNSGRGSGSSVRECSEIGLNSSRGGGIAGGSVGPFQVWRGDAEVACRAARGRRSLTAADAREALAARVGVGFGGCGSPAMPTPGSDMADTCEPVLARASTDSYCSSNLARKASVASIGSGAKPSAVRDALRMSTYSRAHGGGGGGGSFSGGTNTHSGPVPVTTSHLLLKALDSDLYRAGRESHDDCSSVGADSSESEGPRSCRRTKKGAASVSRSGKLLPTPVSSLGNNNAANAITGPAGAAAAAAATPPPGLTLDKLAYSDMHGTVQILSVDDEEVNQMVLEEILTSTGYHFARCMDGLEALEWLCASETMPDLILLDCMMPNMSGHEFCAMLRKVIPGNVLPVIMVSAKSDEENIVEGLRSGSNDFVRKPYRREELLARIETQLRLKSDSWWLAELVNNVDGRETESMKLLKNILPESIIARMQQGQKFVADSHAHVVILFSDIVGFTSLSSKLPTAEVFLMLSNMFTAFDKLTDRFSVYKVETIGDAYMVAAGHDEDEDKARKGSPLMRVLGFARAMLDVVRNITAPNGEKMRIRIGVHCGPAFAGVIGMKCPRYCFLGDTVNTASRMESTGFPMSIHVSENVYRHHPSPEADLLEVGEREIKGKGRMRTYLVRVGAWEQALRDFAVRQQAAAAAAQLLPQQLRQQHLEGEPQGGGPPKQLGGGAGGDAKGGGLPPPPQPLQPQRGSTLCTVGAGGSQSAGQLTPPLSSAPTTSDGNAAGRRVHLSTVTEETSVPPSPMPPEAAVAANGGGATGGGTAGSGGIMLPFGSAVGIRSALSRSEVLAARMPSCSTFGSEAYYCDESSEDGAASTLNGLISATGMLRSCSGSLTGFLSTSALSSAATAAAVAPPAVCSGVPGALDRGGGGTTAEADNGGRQKFNAVHNAVVAEMGLDVATATAAAAAAAHARGHGAGASVATDGGNTSSYMEYLFLGRAVSSPHSAEGVAAGPLLTTATDYLEQRIASQGAQLAVEVTKRHRPQADLDDERRRYAAALQRVALLQQHAVTVAAAAAAAAATSFVGSSQCAAEEAAAAAAVATSGNGSGAHRQPSRHLGGSAIGSVADDGDNSAQQQQQQHQQQQRRQQRRHDLEQWQQQPAGSRCGSSDSPDAEVVIMGPEEDDADTGGGTADAGSAALAPGVASSLLAPIPVPAHRFPMHLPVVALDRGGCASPTGDGPRVAALGGVAGSTDTLVPVSPFVLTGIGSVSNSLWGFGDATATAAAAARCGSQAPRGVANVQVAQAIGGGGATAAAVAADAGMTARVGGAVLQEPRRCHSLKRSSYAPMVLLNSASVVKPASTTADAATTTATNRTQFHGAATSHDLIRPDLKATALAATAGGIGAGGCTVLQPNWLLPRYSLDMLFEELGLLPYLGRFQEQAIRLDQLLVMGTEQLEQLGLRPLGYCLQVREAVMDFARGLLRACEDAAMLAQPRLPPAVAAAAAAAATAVAADCGGCDAAARRS